MSYLLSLYRFIFCRPWFYHLNLHLYKLSLRGIGVLNSEGPKITGEQWLLTQLAKTGQIKIVVDVGANTEAYGENELPTARIFAFEPHPKTFKLLEKAIQPKNRQRIKLFNCGLSDKRGTLKLWDFADDADLKPTQPTSTLASFDKTVIEKLHGQKAQSFSVKIDTLDSVATAEKISFIDLLKIDTEGHEHAVLLGAKKLLQANKIGIVQFEFNEMNVFSGTYLKDFFDLLPQHVFYRLMPNGLFPLGPYRPLTHEIFGFQNIVALPKSLAKASVFQS
jgi:FkbM family methyltransferase